jgi:hypothetical protein
VTGRSDADRAQSHVVGVALLLSMTLLAVAGITAGLGTVVDENAARADADRVTADLDDALRPAETTGVRRGTVRFGDGELQTVDRELRVLNVSGTVRVVDVDALVYTVGDRRVSVLAGALTRGAGDGSRLVRSPTIVAAPDGGDLIVGAPRLGGEVSAQGRTERTLRTNVSHERVTLGEGRYRVAVETRATAAWVDAFAARNATVVATDRDFDGDGVGSVVARFPDRRTAYLVVHELRLEVTDA